MPPQSPYTWDLNTLRYRDTRTGRYVEPARVFKGYERAVRLARGRMATLGAQWREGKLGDDLFEARFYREVKSLHVAGAVLANGGLAQMDAKRWGEVGAVLAREKAYLAGFVGKVRSGELPRTSGKLISRAKSYHANARVAFWRTVTRRYDETGMAVEARRRMGGVQTEHCRGCDAIKNKWLPLSTLMEQHGIGSKECRWFCQCRIEFRRSKGPALDGAQARDLERRVVTEAADGGGLPAASLSRREREVLDKIAGLKEIDQAKLSQYEARMARSLADKGRLERVKDSGRTVYRYRETVVAPEPPPVEPPTEQLTKAVKFFEEAGQPRVKIELTSPLDDDPRPGWGTKWRGNITLRYRADGNFETHIVRTHEEFYRRGIGTRLYREADEFARSQGKLLYVSDERSAEALALHKKFAEQGYLDEATGVFDFRKYGKPPVAPPAADVPALSAEERRLALLSRDALLNPAAGYTAEQVEAATIAREKLDTLASELRDRFGERFTLDQALTVTDRETLRVMDLQLRVDVEWDAGQVVVSRDHMIGSLEGFGGRTRTADEAYSYVERALVRDGDRYLSSFRTDADLPQPFQHAKVRATESEWFDKTRRYHRAHAKKETIEVEELLRTDGPTRYVKRDEVLFGVENMNAKRFADLVEHSANGAQYRLEVGRLDGKLFAWGDLQKWEQVKAYGVRRLEVTVIDYDEAYAAGVRAGKFPPIGGAPVPEPVPVPRPKLPLTPRERQVFEKIVTAPDGVRLKELSQYEGRIAQRLVERGELVKERQGATYLFRRPLAEPPPVVLPRPPITPPVVPPAPPAWHVPEGVTARERAFFKKLIDNPAGFDFKQLSQYEGKMARKFAGSGDLIREKRGSGYVVRVRPKVGAPVVTPVPTPVPTPAPAPPVVSVELRAKLAGLDEFQVRVLEAVARSKGGNFMTLSRDIADGRLGPTLLDLKDKGLLTYTTIEGRPFYTSVHSVEDLTAAWRAGAPQAADIFQGLTTNEAATLRALLGRNGEVFKRDLEQAAIERRYLNALVKKGRVEVVKGPRGAKVYRVVEGFTPGVRGPYPTAGYNSLREMEAWARANFPGVTFDLGGMDVRAANAQMREWERLAREYPEVAKRVRYFGTYRDKSKLSTATTGRSSQKWDRSTYAHASTDGRTIAFNAENHYNDFDKLTRSLTSDARSGWHPPGTENVASIMTHEFGHQVDNWLKGTFTHTIAGAEETDIATIMSEFHKRAAGLTKASQYGKKNESEAWAESFASLRYTPEWQRVQYTNAHKRLLDRLADAKKWIPVKAKDYTPAGRQAREAAARRFLYTIGL